MNISFTYGNDIFIEIDEGPNILLNTILLIIKLNKHFILRTVIYFHPPVIKSRIGHYYCICRRNDRVRELYNDIHKNIYNKK